MELYSMSTREVKPEFIDLGTKYKNVLIVAWWLNKTDSIEYQMDLLIPKY